MGGPPARVHGRVSGGGRCRGQSPGLSQAGGVEGRQAGAVATAGRQVALRKRWPAVTPRNCFPAYVQVFSALIVIIAGAFVITIIYRSALSLPEPHCGPEGTGAGCCGRADPASLQCGRRGGPSAGTSQSGCARSCPAPSGPTPPWLLASQPHGQRVPVCRPPGPTQWLIPRPAAVVCSGPNLGAC